ncbi:rhodanese-like domain-containing protein [Shewanella canadensis]
MGYIGSNLNEGTFEQVAFTEVHDLLQAGEQVIDVREEIEYQAGHIEGAVNIPMSSIRQRLDELDMTRTVYVHCRTGERSYNMAMMLGANGFNVKNIAGSYVFVKAYEDMMQYNNPLRKNILIGDCNACASELEKRK